MNSREPVLSGQVAIVTGASAGLGARMARVLSDAGAAVVMGARRIDRLRELEDDSDAMVAVQSDVTQAADRQLLVDTSLERFGQLDILVNNAGIGNMGPALRQDTESFAGVIEVNLIAAYAMSCAAATAMRASGGGVVVNVASAMGVRSVDQMPDAAYVASKTGLIGLTRELASQWGRHQIRVNALAPGFFPSEMTHDLVGDGDAAPEWLTAQTALNRVGQHGELDGPLLFLASPASSYITGHALVVDGGMTIR